MDSAKRALPFGKDVEGFYDGGCPLCQREIAFLKRWDRLKRIQFTDITNPDFEPASIARTMPELMSQMHGRLPDGTIITGMDVFRRLYAAVGLGWLVGLTGLPGVRQACDIGYALFARNRTWLTGRCKDGSCRVNTDD
jgi:predicted DCC family thiol-disulfide oxidoreductase YuxK